MFDLESAIRFHTEEAEKMKLHKKLNEIILGTEAYKRELQEHTQTAEWLRELQERRKSDNEIPFGNASFSELDSIINAYEMHGNHKKVVELLEELRERRKRPEIVKCKDCENWDTTWQNDSAPNYHYCPMIDGTYSGDFYCAKAERRTDADD